MKTGKWFENWGLTSLKINIGFLETEWNPQEPDRDAAWDLYVELLTRITTQPLDEKHGDEKTALESVYSLFPITRGILKKYGRDCILFSKVSIIVLNQVVRPFTAKWHKISIAEGFKDSNVCTEFRKELEVLQSNLKTYTKMLADIAGVEDLTRLEEENG